MLPEGVEIIGFDCKCSGFCHSMNYTEVFFDNPVLNSNQARFLSHEFWCQSKPQTSHMFRMIIQSIFSWHVHCTLCMYEINDDPYVLFLYYYRPSKAFYYQSTDSFKILFVLYPTEKSHIVKASFHQSKVFRSWILKSLQASSESYMYVPKIIQTEYFLVFRLRCFDETLCFEDLLSKINEIQYFGERARTIWMPRSHPTRERRTFTSF